jgi:hypothetical protein
VLWTVPLLEEVLGTAIDFADVRTFAAGNGGVAGLLSWLEPDAIVVDDEATAAEAAAFAPERDIPVLHVSARERCLRVFRNGIWKDVGDGADPDPETVRNVLAGALFAHRGADA